MGLTYNKVTAVMKGQTAVIVVDVTWCHHPPGAITARVSTSPWIEDPVALGPFHRIRVVGQDDGQLAQLALTSE